MDVQCPRCQTSYEFDDALVTRRGTSVRCTTCAHEFVVRGGRGDDHEAWSVRTRDGLQMEFGSLRDLKRAITQGRVHEDDVLRRGGTPERRVDEIPELRAFLERTRGGAVGVDAQSVALPAVQPAPRAVAAAPRLAPPPDAIELSSPVPPPARGRPRGRVLDDLDDDLAPQGVPRRRTGRIVLGLLIVALVGGSAWAWRTRQPFFVDAVARAQRALAPPPEAPPTARGAELVQAADRALEAGDAELALEHVTKASALVDDAPVLEAQVRVASARADVPYLAALARPDGGRGSEADGRALVEAFGRAVAALEAKAPTSPTLAVARVDLLRLRGDAAGARRLAPSLVTLGDSPEASYALAALDLGEAEVSFPEVVGRLRTAAIAPRAAFRARPALVIALLRSGDVAGAEAELQRLETTSRAHPLLDVLRGAARAAHLDAGPPDAGPLDAGVDAGRAPRRGGKSASAEVRANVRAGGTALRAGDLGTAQRHFLAALDEDPYDSEALAGIADVYRAKHDLAGAREGYRRVLTVNSSYLPALVGLGDVEWELGEHESARRTYREITERFPEGAYPARVRERSGESP